MTTIIKNKEHKNFNRGRTMDNNCNAKTPGITTNQTLVGGVGGGCGVASVVSELMLARS